MSPAGERLRAVGAVLLFLSTALGAPRARGAAIVPIEKLLSDAVELYRAGKLPEALLQMTTVLEQDPENAAAKTYVWTIARRMRDREREASMGGAEKEAAVRKAYALLEERRRRSQASLENLREVYERTRNVRGPAELALSAEGMDKFLGTEFESERVRAEAETYFQKIMGNLSAALERSAFVTRKDHLDAEATLAYYRGDWAEAVKKWEAALGEDPSDGAIRRNADNLKGLIQRKGREDKVRELSAQAETFQRTGYMREAAKSWEQALSLSPKDARIMESLVLCRRVFQKEDRARELKDLTDKGISLYQAGKPSEAVESWLKALQLDPGYEQARVWISHVGKRLETGGPVQASAGEAVPAAAPPVSSDTRQAQELYRQGLLLYAGNEVSKAIDTWRKALQLDPGLIQAQQALRQAQAELKYLE